MPGSNGALVRLHAVAGENVPLPLCMLLLIGGFGATIAAVWPERAAVSAPTASAPVAAAAPTPSAAPAPAAAPTPAPAAPTPAPAPTPKAAPGPVAIVASAGVVAPVDCPPLFAIAFERNRGTPTLDGSAVRGLAGWLAAHPSTTLVIDGHSDGRGSTLANLELSRRRADKVAAAFINAGVPRERLTRRAFGAYAPVVGSESDAGQNRRVILSVAGGPACGASGGASAPSPPSGPEAP